MNRSAIAPCSFVVLALVGASCGTRVERQARTGAAPEVSSQIATQPAPIPADPTGTGTGAGQSNAPSATSDGSSTKTGAGNDHVGQAQGQGSPGDGRTAQPVPPPHGRTDALPGVSRAGATDAPPPAGGSSPSPLPVGQLSDAVVASVGTYSGVVGLVLRPMLEAVQVWTVWINTKGGLNGHHVRLIVADDGGDPARSKALVQDAVERQRVIAFVQMAQGVSGPGTVPYITAKRIPVIGSETASPWFHDTSPMYFPQVPSGPAPLVAALASAAAQQLIPEGKVRLATTTCVEAQVCGEADQVLAKEAPAVGFQQVYRARSSLTQPDFTAECLNARSADAQVFLLVLDINSVSRFAASCARQGYRPTFAILGSNVVERQQGDPNLVGAVAQSTAFPYFETGTSTTDEYQQAMRTYGAKIEPGVGPPVGWVTGKLFEKAAANLPEPPTSDAILRGLWSLRNDDLGGLTYPITFVENKPAPLVNCWWNLRIKEGSWTSPDRFQRHCR